MSRGYATKMSVTNNTVYVLTMTPVSVVAALRVMPKMKKPANAKLQ
jgi:hypothetical protein